MPWFCFAIIDRHVSLPRAELSWAIDLHPSMRTDTNRKKTTSLRRSFNLWSNMIVRWLSGTPKATETQDKWNRNESLSIEVEIGAYKHVEAAAGASSSALQRWPSSTYWSTAQHTHPKKLWFYLMIPCSRLVLTACRNFIGRNSSRHSRPSPTCCLNKLLARKNSPKFCPTLKNPLNLASTTLHLYQNLFWHITCSLRVTPRTVQEVPPPGPPRSNIHETSNSAHHFF